MKLCKKLWLKYQVRKYEKTLLKEGMREAARRRKNIHIGLEERVVINENLLESIYLSQNEQGQTDISPLLALGSESLPEEARRYLVYSKMLDRLKR